MQTVDALKELWASFLSEVVQQGGVSDICLDSTGACHLVVDGRLVTAVLPEKLSCDEGFAAFGAFFGEPHQDDFPSITGLRSFDDVLTIAGTRFRANLSRDCHSAEWVLRVLGKSIPQPDELRIPEQVVRDFSEASHGLFLVVGATGQGKSTSIASLTVERAKERGRRFICLEDPIEFIYPEIPGAHFRQRQVGRHVESYQRGLVEALRQRPDTIIVQEIRERSEAETALSAACSGHFVVATLHAGNCADALQRYISIVESSASYVDMLASAMRGVLAQRLLFDETCGQVSPVFEYLRATTGVRANIRSWDMKAIERSIETGRRKGMISFAQSFQEREDEGLLARGEHGYTRPGQEG